MAGFDVKAVTFDATGTLFHAPDLGKIYARVLGRHGVEVTHERAAELVATVWKEFGCRGASAEAGTSARLGADRFRAHPGGAKGWWTEFLARMLDYLESSIEPGFAAAELFDRFGRAESWQVFAEVPEVLRDLRARGLAVGVVSNWDHRLPHLLRELGLEGFDAVAVSAEVGFEKPHPAIFEACRRELGLPAQTCLHVGDRRLEDCEGARGAGMAALLLDRSSSPGGGAELTDLGGLLDRLGLRPGDRSC